MDAREHRTDKDIERFAAELNERVRTLNSLTERAPGLTQPGTAYTVLGNLAQTAFRLSQTAENLDAFLHRELDAGHLGHDRGDDPEPSVLKAHDALAQATEQSMDLGEAFRRAQGALVAIQAPRGRHSPVTTHRHKTVGITGRGRRGRRRARVGGQGLSETDR